MCLSFASLCLMSLSCLSRVNRPVSHTPVAHMTHCSDTHVAFTHTLQSHTFKRDMAPSSRSKWCACDAHARHKVMCVSECVTDASGTHSRAAHTPSPTHTPETPHTLVVHTQATRRDWSRAHSSHTCCTYPYPHMSAHTHTLHLHTPMSRQA